MSHTRHNGDRVLTDGGSGGMGRWASLGVATYLVLGLGTAISVWLLGLVGDALSSGPGGSTLPGIGGMMTGDALSGAIALGLLVVVFLGAAVATGLGLLAGRTAGARESAAAVGAVSSGVGVFVTAIIMVVLLLLLGTGSGTGTSDIVTLVGMAVGLAIGVGITGAVAAGVGERSATW